MNRRRITLTVAAVIAAPLLMASSCDSADNSQRAKNEQAKRDAFSQQAAAVPYPGAELRDSLERRQLREKLLRNNDPNRIQYVYLLGDTGTYLGYYAIKGKVSSNQSQMLPIDEELNHGSYGQSVVEAAGDDGSFGLNEPGIFFITTEGVMVTTDMRYVVSDSPLNVDAPKLNVPKK